MGYIDVAAVSRTLPDGRVLFSEVSFRVGEGAKVALIGANGTGKTTLVRMIAGDIPADEGAITRGGGLGVMRQLLVHDDRHLADLALSLAPARLRQLGERLAAAEADIAAAERRGKYSNAAEKAQVAYADALTAWGDAGGYDFEVLCDTVSILILEKPWDETRHRVVRTLSGGEQKRFALELLLRGPEEVLLLDEPDNFLDVPAKRWLEERINESEKTILYVSHDRELLANTAQRIVTLEAGDVWTHGGGFATWHEARVARWDRFEELRRRWDEEHQKLKDLVAMYRKKATYNDGMASRLRAAETRLAKFEAIGPPPTPPREQDIKMTLRGGRTGKRAVMCEQLELDNLTFPFDLEVWYGDRVAVLGANGTGKSHFLRLLARGGSEGAGPVDGQRLEPVLHNGSARLGARVMPGHFSQTHDRPELMGRTLREILWKGDEHRPSLERSAAMSKLSRYELAPSSEQVWESLSGGQQARFLVLLLELSGATLLLLDEPTDNLDLASAEALEEGLGSFDGTVIAVTHDRWFTRGFDRFVLFGGDGEVVETDEPVWDVR
ncbi:ABC-F family ATP-binding cassette domain-containing protein [Phytomonospora endophytica]|uniref:ATPase subunit of ABC transporter with duplicated ATPase domains n=1 Tax=Phytomonospora endophytica TaxID=714109 RepID=A0A841FC98_9ACTN|nr:ATP-binding cassette domain-containing protein [Phytomonospora endophytica]MBB6033414.1 ATPase subunit of ABC transporter with duplicated ATPase domains [Phytomonospora endophytica]GIG70815.1 ABC transporter ATP-binding protein [Phytomonospora endophytica]